MPTLAGGHSVQGSPALPPNGHLKPGTASSEPPYLKCSVNSPKAGALPAAPGVGDLACGSSGLPGLLGPQARAPLLLGVLSWAPGLPAWTWRTAPSSSPQLLSRPRLSPASRRREARCLHALAPRRTSPRAPGQADLCLAPDPPKCGGGSHTVAAEKEARSAGYLHPFQGRRQPWEWGDHGGTGQRHPAGHARVPVPLSSAGGWGGS